MSYEYINSLTDFLYNGASHVDIRERGRLFWLLERLYSKIIRTLFSSKRPTWVRGSLMPKVTKQNAGTFDEKKFYNATRNYVGEILSFVNKSEAKYLVGDQFFPPSAVNNYLKYIPTSYIPKVIIVDRDPRDLYFTCKYYLHTKSIPTDDVNIFCDWFRWTRGQSLKDEDSDSILRIKFEDAIYDYEYTRKKLLDFCEVSNEMQSIQYKCFDPKKSINNTQVWERYPGHREELEYIENHLLEYCYDFEEKSDEPDYQNGQMFDC